MNLWVLSIAILALILIPLAPQLVRLRIRFFRWIKWNWAVNVLENHFRSWVLFFRILLFVVAVLLLFFGWTG